MHGLCVVGMDAEQGNTISAQNRCKKVEKAHRGHLPMQNSLSTEDSQRDSCVTSDRGEEVIAVVQMYTP